jgi:ABC-type multidrug transport system fused ATPase/permease subunit
VLLDEPTSSVDTHNERLIYGNLLAAWRDRCVVSAIHRLHLLPLFDMVYVMQDGRIVERGPAERLIRRGGLLARMHASYQDGAPRPLSVAGRGA